MGKGQNNSGLNLHLRRDQLLQGIRIREVALIPVGALVTRLSIFRTWGGGFKYGSDLSVFFNAGSAPPRHLRMGVLYLLFSSCRSEGRDGRGLRQGGKVTRRVLPVSKCRITRTGGATERIFSPYLVRDKKHLEIKELGESIRGAWGLIRLPF